MGMGAGSDFYGCNDLVASALRDAPSSQEEREPQ